MQGTEDPGHTLGDPRGTGTRSPLPLNHNYVLCTELDRVGNGWGVSRFSPTTSAAPLLPAEPLSLWWGPLGAPILLSLRPTIWMGTLRSLVSNMSHKGPTCMRWMSWYHVLCLPRRPRRAQRVETGTESGDSHGDGGHGHGSSRPLPCVFVVALRVPGHRPSDQSPCPLGSAPTGKQSLSGGLRLCKQLWWGPGHTCPLPSALCPFRGRGADSGLASSARVAGLDRCGLGSEA